MCVVFLKAGDQSSMYLLCRSFSSIPVLFAYLNGRVKVLTLFTPAIEPIQLCKSNQGFILVIRVLLL